jgi:hypothetical protein
MDLKLSVMLYNKLPNIDNIHEIIMGILKVFLALKFDIINDIIPPIEVNDIMNPLIYIIFSLVVPK